MAKKKLVKKLTKEFKKALAAEYSRGFSDGFDIGSEDDSGDYDTGYNDGWAERFENIKYRLNSLFDTYMTTNKLRDAKSVKEIAEYLDFFVEPFSEEKYQENLEKDGF